MELIIVLIILALCWWTGGSVLLDYMIAKTFGAYSANYTHYSLFFEKKQALSFMMCLAFGPFALLTWAYHVTINRFSFIIDGLIEKFSEE